MKERLKMTKLICSNKMCNKEIPLDKDNNKNEKYIMCPFCAYQFLNPYYEGEKNV